MRPCTAQPAHSARGGGGGCTHARQPLDAVGRVVAPGLGDRLGARVELVGWFVCVNVFFSSSYLFFWGGGQVWKGEEV